MKAIQVSKFGDRTALAQVELADPAPGTGEVTIDVTYTAVGLVDVMMRRGDFPLPLPIIPGLSVAGSVRALGAGVTSLRVGQPVAAFTLPPTMGGYASIARVNAALAIPLDTPHGTVPLDAAAAIIVNGPTAYMALQTVGRMCAGSSVVIHGATGALGSALVQVARHLGARPLIGTIGDAGKHDAAMKLGCSHVLTTTDDLATRVRELTNGLGADVVVDPVGGKLRRASLDMLKPLGHLVVVGHASNDPDTPVSPTDIWLGNQSILGLNVGGLSATQPEHFNSAGRTIMDLVARGEIRVSIDDTLPFAEVAEAHKRLEERTVVGTLLLRMDQ